MTDNQKDLVRRLLAGAYVVKVHGSYKLYEGNMSPVMWLRSDALRGPLEELLVDKDGRLVISRKAIRSLHGKTWIKQYYKRQLQARQEAIQISKSINLSQCH